MTVLNTAQGLEIKGLTDNSQSNKASVGGGSSGGASTAKTQPSPRGYAAKRVSTPPSPPSREGTVRKKSRQAAAGDAAKTFLKVGVTNSDGRPEVSVKQERGNEEVIVEEEEEEEEEEDVVEEEEGGEGESQAVAHGWNDASGQDDFVDGGGAEDAGGFPDGGGGLVTSYEEETAYEGEEYYLGGDGANQLGDHDDRVSHIPTTHPTSQACLSSRCNLEGLIVK